MFTKNRQDIPQTDDLIYADPPARQRHPDPARRRHIALVVLAAVSLIACLTTVGALASSIRGRENRYLRAQELLTLEAYDDAMSAFEALGDYKDSQAQFARLGQWKTAYDEAVALMQRAEAGQARTDPIEGYEAAAAALEALGDYADAPALAEACRTAAETLRAERDTP